MVYAGRLLPIHDSNAGEGGASSYEQPAHHNRGHASSATTRTAVIPTPRPVSMTDPAVRSLRHELATIATTIASADYFKNPHLLPKHYQRLGMHLRQIAEAYRDETRDDTQGMAHSLHTMRQRASAAFAQLEEAYHGLFTSDQATSGDNLATHHPTVGPAIAPGRRVIRDTLKQLQALIRTKR